MTGGREEHKKGEGKGFAGLSSLVSDVDTTPPPAPKTEPAVSAPSTERPTPQAAQPQPSQPHQSSYQEPAKSSSSGSSGGKWVLGIAAVIGVLWLIGQSDKSPTSPAPAYSPPAQTATPSYSPPVEPQAPSRPQESMPPVGQDLVFSTAQIRYCLAEDIRLEGARSAVNNYIDSDVDRFNAMVADYNSRCGSFRYRSGALESARRDIEPYRSQLQAEGRNRFARTPSTGSLSTPAPSRPAPNATVQAIQRKLNELGYEAGTADGLMGRGTRSAIIAFQQDRGLAATGVADQALLRQLEQAPPNFSNSVPQAKSSPPLSVAPLEKGPIRDGSNNRITIPANSFAYSGNAKGWACKSGYRDTGNECAYIEKPKNSFHYSGNAKGWACNSGFRDTGNDCAYIIKPQNSFHYSGNTKGWACNSGYRDTGNDCVYIDKPQNSFHFSGNAKGWACNSGYRDTGNDCTYINKPQNSFHYSGNAKGWACNSGYKEVGDECRKLEASR